MTKEATSNQDPTNAVPTGKVFLVGAGPGDPELLTVKARRLLDIADVVLYDNLVSQDIVDLVTPNAERVYVGKKRNLHTLAQEEINATLVRLALQGKNVLRLKGGDPFIFGRGGEEVETLKAHQVPFEIVPGISAANGVSCYTGIPLTHRDYAQAVTFVTGHLKDGSNDLDWTALARPSQTVVIYMGLVALPSICRQLIAHGLPESHPIAVVEKGTTVKQRTCIGTLGTITGLVEAAGLKPPSLVIVGDVVSLHEKLAWFGTTDN